MISDNRIVVISFVLANYHGEGVTDEFIVSRIKELAEEIDLYKLEFIKKPGHHYSAAFDWKVVGRIGSVTSVLGFLLFLYNDYIVPEKDEESDVGIYINIDNVNIIQPFMIGKDIKSHIDLEHLLKELKINDSLIDYDKISEEIEELKKSEYWKKVE